jgi:hypothetical protein
MRRRRARGVDGGSGGRVSPLRRRRRRADDVRRRPSAGRLERRRAGAPRALFSYPRGVPRARVPRRSRPRGAACCAWSDDGAIFAPTTASPPSDATSDDSFSAPRDDEGPWGTASLDDDARRDDAPRGASAPGGPRREHRRAPRARRAVDGRDGRVR